MKKLLLLLSICIATSYVYSETIFQDGFEYANTEGEVPLGWTSPEKQWICGQFENDHNRKPHHGNWYTYTEEEEAWLFMRADALPGIHYNLSFWTISDGPFQMEILYGNNPNPESMSGTIAPANEIDSENYLQFSVEYDLYENYDLYLGFHAISLGGTALCIDDVAIDQMHQYDFMVKVMTTDTLDLAYGESANFRFSVLNTGYDRETLVLSSPSEMFTDTHCFIDGEAVTRFDIEPNENIIIDVTTTLIDQEIPYTYAWLDVMVGSTHNCNTGMASFFVRPIPGTQISENKNRIIIYPNPACKSINIDHEEFENAIIYDANGRHILSSQSKHIDIQSLKPGLYSIAITTDKQTFSQNFLKQ
ncbi:MAG: T9SS type A sorting domain-containing protein [Bacteroidales bacterium]|nr:T9SS type A sorting domain-containing protein [Bacteroidales bacterium]